MTVNQPAPDTSADQAISDLLESQGDRIYSLGPDALRKSADGCHAAAPVSRGTWEPLTRVLPSGDEGVIQLPAADPEADTVCHEASELLGSDVPHSSSTPGSTLHGSL